MLGFLERKIKSKKISVEEINAQKEIEKKRKLKQEKEKAIVEVMKRTGWERGYTEQCIADARRRTRCAYKEFVMYKFYALDARVQEQLFLIYDSKRIAAKYDTDKQ